ncbi:hypothetical protein BRARA_E02567 [Brassica rapa]|uniref:DUF4283 domain-containing protein n=1 Tax=Brassica campestris TaxID=3711 RepID=A0A397ZD51_BRACM|nr:hypothetical protein BRARA_E02567 [Brassica rapa]
MSQSSLLIRKGASSNGDRRALNSEDDIIRIPECDITDAKERFRLTLMGRVFHTRGRSIDALINLLPRSRIWNVEGRVRGLNLGNGRFQFDFDNEVDLQTVLNKRPCHFNQWSFALERWEPFTSETFPNTIPFWINVTGIPVHFWNDKTFTEIANALGKKLLVDEKKARIQVSIDVDKPLQFERRVGFPNGEIGKVTLTYEGLHRHCFTCNLISHDENTCPQLTPEEREYKRKQRLENNASNDQTRLPIQGSQGLYSRHHLKRPRSPQNGRYQSSAATSRSNELYREEKRRKSTPSSFSTREPRETTYHAYDRKSSSRQDNRQLHHGREVWNRLEIPSRREGTHRGGRISNHLPRSLARKEDHRPLKQLSQEWRPRRNSDTSRSKSNVNNMTRQSAHGRMEKSHATIDSQKTISENRVSLESGEIIATNKGEVANIVSEEERIRRLKGKSIAIDSPTSQAKDTPFSNPEKRSNNLIISERHSETPHSTKQAQRYDLPPTEQGGKFLELEMGSDQDLDAPITDLELAEVDNLVLETERLEMAEKILRDENMFDADNDDLLGDSPDFDAEKIEAITQLSPANAVYQKTTRKEYQPISARSDAPPSKITQKKSTEAYVPKGLLKKKTPRSPDIKGAQASKKLQVLSTRASPKKKTAPGKKLTSSSTMVPRFEVFPSASSKKSVSLSGSVVSQKPPSKKI